MLRKAVWLLLFLAIFLVYFKPPGDPDLGWHFRNGAIILDEGRFSFADEFSHTMTGFKWANSYWLSEVLLVLGERFLGLLGLTLLFTGLGALGLMMALKAGRGRREILPYVLVGLGGAIFSTAMTGVRPQTLSFLLTATLWWWVRRYLRRPLMKRLLFLPPFFLVWANLHAGFVLGLALLGVVWFGEAVVFLGQRFGGGRFSFRLDQPALSANVLVQFLFGVGVTVAVTILNPYGIYLWKTILNDASSLLIKNNIQEWQAPNTHTEVGLMLLIFTFCLWLSSRVTEARLRLSEGLALLTFLTLAFSAVRHIPLLVALAAPVMAEAGSTKLVIHAFDTTKAVCLFLILLILTWGSAVIPKTVATTLDWRLLTDGAGYPRKAVEWLREHPQEGTIFNHYGWGGFLIWQLPEVKTFIDGRMCGWQTTDKPVFANYLDVIKMKADFERIWEKYDVTWVLIEQNTPLAHYLKLHPAWHLVYEDAYAVVISKHQGL